jgi:hypothetical protein
VRSRGKRECAACYNVTSNTSAEQAITDETEPAPKPKASDRGQAKRAADYKKRLKEKGITPLTVQVSEDARLLFNRAAELIRDGTEPAEAFRIVAGNEPKASDQPATDRDQQHAFTERTTVIQDERDQQRQQHAELIQAVKEAQRRQEAMLARLDDPHRPKQNDRDQQQAVMELAALSGTSVTRHADNTPNSSKP